MIIALIGRKNGQSGSAHTNLQQLLINFADIIDRRGHQVIFHDETYTNFIKDEKLDYYNRDITDGSFSGIGSNADFCIVMGGDGTMLDAAKSLSAYSISILGINLGHVGFITDVPSDFDQERIVEMLEKKEYTTEARRMIKTNDGFYNKLALNDVVISRSTGKILEFKVRIDNEYAYTARGDGLMVSTPTGSTAYAMSAGGPIIHPTARVIEVIPILPQSLSCRPLIVNDTSMVDFELISGEAEVFVDGNVIRDLKPGQHLEIMRADRKVEFIHPKMKELTYSYYGTLSEKLNWHFVPGTPH